jgi:carbon starvation protein
LQDFLGTFVPRLKNTASWSANVTATFLLVSAWGYFLYQGAIDPEGIAKSLWPIFGISNQLLAVIAFCLGTTILIKMGRVRHAWVTMVPMMFLTVVTFTAGWMKIFSPKAAGFLPAIAKHQSAIAAGLPPEKLEASQRALTNAYVDIGITALFLVLVATIVTGCVYEWWLILSGRKTSRLHESPYVAQTTTP